MLCIRLHNNDIVDSEHHTAIKMMGIDTHSNRECCDTILLKGI